jgi:hypothetical protein
VTSVATARAHDVRLGDIGSFPITNLGVQSTFGTELPPVDAETTHR